MFNKEKREERKAQKKAASEAAAIQKASRIKELFQQYDLLDKPLSAKGWRHEIATDIWILKDVFAKGGVVIVQFVLPLSSRHISFYWSDFRMQVDYGNVPDVVETLFLPARQRYLVLEKEILAIQEIQKEQLALAKADKLLKGYRISLE